MENPSIAENLSTTYFTFSVIYLKKKGVLYQVILSLLLSSTNPANVIGPETDTLHRKVTISLNLAVAL